MDSKYIVFFNDDKNDYAFFATKREVLSYLMKIETQYGTEGFEIYELGQKLDFKVEATLEPKPVKKELRTTINEREKDVKRTTIGAYGAATEK